MGMGILSWAEAHNEHDDNGSSYVRDQKTVVEVGFYVEYECIGDVELFRNIPCSAYITEMYRVEYNSVGGEDSRIQLRIDEFPPGIEKQACENLVEGWTR